MCIFDTYNSYNKISNRSFGAEVDIARLVAQTVGIFSLGLLIAVGKKEEE
jgi:hypothetical protein